MISFQWITLSFLLVSGALFAYLIPYSPSYLCDPACASGRSDYHRPKATWSYFRQNYGGVFRGSF
ncbi:hypothetical protein BACSTE_00854 [Bacteroides stercoris ATCC 43183]|uniref:Uncharacterized protein n=1 Tax=Bacteroides stercoris ATCC 43183 TaxID=449673 RepID=B0NMT6_BACSE|nr:hypothetical protein BACSTE_00854 [Bacteroides stercoris ATCC 43183]